MKMSHEPPASVWRGEGRRCRRPLVVSCTDRLVAHGEAKQFGAAYTVQRVWRNLVSPSCPCGFIF